MQQFWILFKQLDGSLKVAKDIVYRKRKIDCGVIDEIMNDRF